MDKNQDFNALINLYYRGFHANNDPLKIFDDFLAYKFLKKEELDLFDNQFLSSIQGTGSPVLSQFKDRTAALGWIMRRWSPIPLVVSRAQYTEDLLEDAVINGVKQYIILGAGMDTFIFRRKDLIKNLKVFEVDHPDVQEFKRRRLAELGWEIPRNAYFIPADFTQENLQALKGSSFDSQTLCFFSMLGVTPYLPLEKVLTLLKSIAEISFPGSLVVFDYCDKDAFNPEKAAKRVYAGIMMASQSANKMITCFDPPKLEEDLKKSGFKILEHLSTSDIQKRYFEGRTDGYTAYEHAHFICAEVV